MTEKGLSDLVAMEPEVHAADRPHGNQVAKPSGGKLRIHRLVVAVAVAVAVGTVAAAVLLCLLLVGAFGGVGGQVEENGAGELCSYLNVSNGVLVVNASVCPVLSLNETKLQHKPKKLARSKLATFAGLTDIDRFMGPQRLDPILQVRVPGTPGNARVRQYITSTFQSLNSWDVQEDRFMGSTPFGEKEFVNIIATLRSPSQPVESDLKLVLACHHDSKLFQQFEFVAATDSAVPCAMLLDLAHNLKASLDAKTYTPYTLQLIFFDGEEAFQSWTSADSLYGSRHLAEKWGRDVLNGIGLFVLLDLIGEANPTFSNYFPNNQQSDRMYKHLQNIETRLRQSGLLFANSQNSPYFTSQTHRGRIADDHLPFLERGVDVVHAIPVPFPNAWHKAGDNKASLDPNTISDLSKIFHIFVAEFLHLAPPE